MSVRLRTWGELACFTRPEMKVERVSYPVMTPSAARGVLEAILYRPQFRWQVRRISVCRPIRFISLRRNEVKSRLSARRPEPLYADEDRTQRNTLALRDVEYVIEADLGLTAAANQPRQRPIRGEEESEGDSVAKYLAMFQRRAEKGQCFTQPYFGCREFAAHFEPAEGCPVGVVDSAEAETDLGLMIFDVFDLDEPQAWKPGPVEAKPQITLFHAALRNGVLVERGRDRLPEWAEVRGRLGGAR